MKVIGAKLGELGMMITLLSLVHMVSCEDRLDTPCPSVDEGERVEVSLCVGLADEEDGAGLGSTPLETKSEGGMGFDVHLVSTKTTKAVILPDDPLATAKPDQLYNLEVRQYNQSGACINSGTQSLGNIPIGQSFTVSLAATGDTDCQLLIIARGSANMVAALGGSSLSDIQSRSYASSSIDAIDTEEEINAMPYLLHLPKVKVVNDGGTYKIQSPDGADVRILLRRLATRFTLAWDNDVNKTNYNLKEVLLQSIPVDYRLLPPSGSDTYPSLMDQYVTIPISGKLSIREQGSYTCWLPAVVRGDSPNATSAYYRTKENAPNGSSYVTFISQNPNNIKQKLDYRVYLGGTSVHNFDLKENTNYIYKVTMSHTTLPVDDKRVTIIDPILASDNNNNQVPTANCFMVPPGGAFCFDPYTYLCNGQQIDNTYLTGGAGAWCDRDISTVKLIWQTKDEGNIGEPAMGIVNSDDDHTNIVEWKNNKIYCRVASNTKGGSGGIAAYDSKGKIVWSWHVWVTGYAPSAVGSETVVTENQRKFVLNSGTAQLPLMDRNLGAYDGYTEVPCSILLMSRANGFHYNTGRKDPFPSSYTSRELSAEYRFTTTTDRPARDVLVRFKADGVNWIIPSILSGSNSIEDGYSQPLSPGKLSNAGLGWTVPKTLHDPCPAGWRIPTKDELQAFVDLNKSLPSDATIKSQGGVLLKFDNSEIETYLRLSGYVIGVAQLNNVGYCGYMLTSSKTGNYSWVFTVGLSGAVAGDNGKKAVFTGKEYGDIHSTRCIQERAD